jgi:hypothetical protein
MGAALFPVRARTIFLVAPAGLAVYVLALYVLRAISPEEWELAKSGLLARIRPDRAA